MTQEEKIIDAREFASVIVTCELAKYFNKDKPNRAIKHALKCLSERVTSPRIKLVCRQGLKSVFASGWLARQSNNIVRVGGYDVDEYLRIGASL
jgi:hypothetical protein